MDLQDDIDTLLFVVADSLRFDARESLPTVTELADRNAEFTSFYTPGASTPSSMPGFFQSRSPIDHRGYGLELPPEIPTLPEHLTASGIKCAGWHSNRYVSADYGFDRGFNIYQDLNEKDQQNKNKTTSPSWRVLGRHLANTLGIQTGVEQIFERLGRHGVVDINPKIRAEHAINACLDWLPNQPDQITRFGYLHLMDTHLPYLPPAEYREQTDDIPIDYTEIYDLWQDLVNDPTSLSDDDVDTLHRLYLAEANYMDDQIQLLIDQLKERGLWESTALVFTGDHGELFRDREVPRKANVKHPDYLCEELTHTPLVIAGGPIPEIKNNTLTSGLDVAPTIVDLLDCNPPKEWKGRIIDSEEYTSRERIFSALAHTYGGGTGSRVEYSATHVAVRTDEVAVLWWLADDHLPEFYYRTSLGEEKVDPNNDDRFHFWLREAQEHGQLSSKVSDHGNTGNNVSKRLRDLGYVD